MESLEKAILAMDTISDRKAVDPVLFEVGGMTSIADYFIVASGNSSRQVQSISQHLTRKMRDEKCRTIGVEGEQEGQWVLLDFGDLVIHLFYQPVREQFDLEGLWIEAPRINPDEHKKERQS